MDRSPHAIVKRRDPNDAGWGIESLQYRSMMISQQIIFRTPKEPIMAHSMQNLAIEDTETWNLALFAKAHLASNQSTQGQV